MVICCDIDGVLANFNKTYMDLLVATTGKNLFPFGYEPQVWNFPEALGYTSSEIDYVWNSIQTNPVFWSSLLPLPGAFELLHSRGINDRKNDIYFVTDRMGVRAKYQTEDWLRKYVIQHPTVLLTKYKGLAAHALHADFVFDDRFENIQDVERESPMTRAFLINRPYNQVIRFPGEDDVIRRADSVKEVLNTCGI